MNLVYVVKILRLKVKDLLEALNKPRNRFETLSAKKCINFSVYTFLKVCTQIGNFCMYVILCPNAFNKNCYTYIF